MSRYRIVKKLKEVTHWPHSSTSHYTCQVKEDDHLWERDIPVKEYELLTALQQFENCCVFASDIDALQKLIEEYGSEKYSEGADDNEQSHAGADL